MKQYLNKQWRKLIASFFVAIMVFQAFTGSLNVLANEMGKINAADSYGKYNQQTLPKKQVVLPQQSTPTQEGIKKDPVLDEEDATYDEGLEVKDKRTENTKTYELNDGRFVTQVYFEPVHKKENNTFVDIDNTLENSSFGRSTPIYENKDGLYDFSVQDQTMSISNESKQVFQLTNNEAKLDVYSVKENVILYSDAYKNIDMEYRLGASGVATSFYINGEIDEKELKFSIEKGDLKVKDEAEALLFLDVEGKVVYSYQKPRFFDAKQTSSTSNLSYTEEGSKLNVTISLEDAWVQSNERSFPIKMSSRVANENVTIDVISTYNRSAEPNTISDYYDRYVGYEDGSTTGGILLGVTRTYVHVGGLDLGSDKLILSAKLSMWKRASYTDQWNTLEIGKTSGYVNPYDATWANKPSVSKISTTNVRSDPGWQDFDVTSYIQDIYEGKNNTIELKATNESSAYTPNVFSSESGTGVPKITIEYKLDYNVDPELGIDNFDTEMRLFAKQNIGFEAFSFDGIAKPDAQVVFDLVERGKDNVLLSETSKGNASKYFVDPIYITNHIATTQTYEKRNGNYTTDYVFMNRIPKFDTPYEYKVKVKKGSDVSTKDFRTDSFIKYKVKTGDNLQNLASYYGTTIDQIKKDNNLSVNTIKEDDVLLLRFQKNNPKVSKDVYTPPIRTITYKAKYVNRGPNCSSGTCEVIDPVNATTGNYFYEDSDFVLKDAEDIPFIRYYNSTGPQLSNMFGNGFTSTLESYLSYDKNGNMLYFAGDGKIYEFQKDGNGFKSRNKDKKEITITNGKVTIKDTSTGMQYNFNEYGYLNTTTTREGVVSAMSYDSMGLLTSVKVGEKTITLAYDDRKLVKDITLPSGHKISYTYDASRNLVSFVDALGSVTKYTYDANNYLTSITNKNNVVSTKNTYDNEGRVIKQLDGNQNETTISYANDSTTITNSDGVKDIYTFNEDYDITSVTQDGRVTSAYTYDDKRNITSIVDAKGQTTSYLYNGSDLIKAEYPDATYEEYQYDASHNLTYKRERTGEEITYTYTGNDVATMKTNIQAASTYVYDAQRRVIKETNEQGVSKSYTYANNRIATITHTSGLVEFFEYDNNGYTLKEGDNQGKLFTYIYDKMGRMLQKNYSDSTNEQWTYDAFGNISTYKDRIGGVTTNSYDLNNNLLESRKGTLTQTYTYDSNNKVLSETNEQGLTTSYEYDALGNKTKEMDAYGHATTYVYDDKGNITQTIDPIGNHEVNVYDNNNLISSTSKEGLTTTYEYDELNREVKKIHPNGHVESKTYKGILLDKEVTDKETIIEHFYDDYKREIKTVTTYSDGIVSTSESIYDVYGNVVETKQDGVSTKHTFDVYGRELTLTDALNHTTKKEYDVDGNIIKETDARGNATMTQYDDNQNIVAITDKNGNKTTKTYNVLGQLVQEKDALGFTTTYTYNDMGQLASAQDAYGVQSYFHYDEYGNLIETLLGDNIVESKGYDSYGREIATSTLDKKTSKVLDNLGRISESCNELTGLTTYYTYDTNGNVIQETDSEGRKIENQYDIYNRKIQSVDAYGRKETTSYNIRDQVVETTSSDGLISKTKYDNLGNAIQTTNGLGVVTNNAYNALGKLVTSKDGTIDIENIYDANNQIIEVKNYNNATSTKTKYDANGNIVSNIDALGREKQTIFDKKNQAIESIDAKGNKESKEYDANGNIIKQTDALGNTKQYQFNEFGLLTMEVDERGFETIYEYNEDLLLERLTNAQGHQTSFEYNQALQKVKETNPNGGVTSYTYDAYGRVVQTTQPNGKEIKKTYNTLDQIVQEVDGDQTKVTTYDGLGRLVKVTLNNVVQTTNEYNEYNQITTTKDANNNVSTFKYDVRSNVIYANEKGSISETTYDENNKVTKIVENKTYITNNTYDAAGQLLEVKVNNVAMKASMYDVNGNEVSVIEQGVEVKKEVDALNRVVKVEIPSPNLDKTFVVVQTITYDESGNAIKRTDGNGHVEEKKYDASNNVVEEVNKIGNKTTYAYDGLNNVVKVQNNEERYVSYTYDLDNNVIYKNVNGNTAEYVYDNYKNLLLEKDEYGYVTKNTYDRFHHKTKEIKPDGTSIVYTYDNLGNKLSENDHSFKYDARNNVITATSKEGSVETSYDAFNQKTSIKDTNGNIVEYTYNNNKLVAEKEYAGIKVSYQYNNRNLLMSVNKDGNKIASYTYNERNEVVSLIQPQATTQKTYDVMGRILTQTSTKGSDVVYQVSNAYDANDNIIKEVVNGHTNTYTFNNYDELTSSNKYMDGKQVKTSYQYDLYGNQVVSSTSDGTKVYKYNDKHQVTSIESNKGIQTLSYDANGNLEKKVNETGRVDTYRYNAFDKLTTLVQGQYVYDYAYDAQSERVKETKTDTKDYHYDVWYDTREEVDVVSDEEISNTFEKLKQQVETKQENGNVCVVEGQDKYDVTYYKEPEVTTYTLDRVVEHTQVLQTNRDVYISSNTLLQKNQTDVITGLNESVVAVIDNNKATNIAYSDYGTSKDVNKTLGYNGEMMDATGLIYLRSRYYDPTTARFVQIDKNFDGDKQNVASNNKYVYTLNNPYKYVDRNGDFFIIGFIIVVSTLVTAKIAYNEVTKPKPKSIGLKTVPSVVSNHIVKPPSKTQTPTPVDSGTNNNQAGGQGEQETKVCTFKDIAVKAACPESDPFPVIGDVIHIVQSGLDYPKLFIDIVETIATGGKMDTIKTLLHCAKATIMNGKVVTLAKVEKAIYKIYQSTNIVKQTIVKTMTDSFKTQKAAFKKANGFIAMFIEVGIDVALSLGQMIFGFISYTRMIAQSLASIIYTVLKNAASFLIKAILTPFIGPFAWILSILFEVGVDFIDFLIDLKSKLADFVEWVMTNTWNFISGLVNAIVGVA